MTAWVLCTTRWDWREECLVAPISRPEHYKRRSMNKLGKHLVHLPSFKRSTTSCGKFLKRWEYQIILPASWETCKKVKKQELEPDMEKRNGSKLGKEYVKAVYRHPAYLTYMQSTSSEIPGWMKHKLESRLPGEISITSDMQIIPPLWQKVKKN